MAVSREQVEVRWSRHRRAVAVVVAILAVAAVCGLLLGPGRGAREDLGQVREDLASTEDGIYRTLAVNRGTLDRITRQLRVTRDSLRIQRDGLQVARDAQAIARTGVDATEDIRSQTRQTLRTLDEVIDALGPLRRLRGDIRTVVASTEAGVDLARSTLALARTTLSTGQQALAVARRTLTTLLRSEQVQRDLLAVARQTLAEVERIDRKIPTPPVFPTGG